MSSDEGEGFSDPSTLTNSTSTKKGIKRNDSMPANKLEKKAKVWTDDEVADYIDMLLQISCLWDAYDETYTKRDGRELAYTAFGTSMTKRTQREMLESSRRL